MAQTPKSYSLRPYSKHEWRIAGTLFVSYLIASSVAANYIPASAELYPSFAIALSALFFGGLRLFPIVYFTALIAGILVGFTPSLLIIFPLAVTLQAIAGAYALRTFNFDPLFRRYRDTAYLMMTVAAISLIEPTLRALGAAIQGEFYSFADWGHTYIATAFCFLILTSFILRWFTKPRFNRTSVEVAEIAAVFSVLVGIDFTLFSNGMQTVFGISLIYILLVPLFFIALRLRPRFVTLAILITSLFAIGGVFIHEDASTLAEHLFNTELFLIALSATFFIITSIKEELRVNTSLTLSQLATLENAVARVSSESSAKNDFITILAHELRNPLAPVVSAIELLKLKGPRDADDAKALDMMAERMGVVQRLLDDLLDISRISEGKITLKHEAVDLETILKRALLSTDHHRKELHQQLIFQASEVPLCVAGDPVRLEQIFSNLLTNASKYSDPGDTVTLLVRQKGNNAEIEVSDEGVGLSPHVLESIFIPFHQLEQDERSTKGLGIGLALVRSFTLMHGGTVTASSNGPGLGSHFTVTLPLLLQGTLSSGGDTHEYRALASRRKRRALVLVVDDNDEASGNIGRLLEIVGRSVIYAYRAGQAIEQASSLSPDIVFINVDMHHQDGHTIAKTLRERGFKGHLIALTESRAKSLEESEKNDLFEHYLLKPVGLPELKRTLSELTHLAK